jgi:hypothetical protein
VRIAIARGATRIKCVRAAREHAWRRAMSEVASFERAGGATIYASARGRD